MFAMIPCLLSLGHFPPLCPVSIPCNVSQPHWRKEMIEEMHALEKNKTWDAISLPCEKEPIGCKWVFSVKLQPNDIVKLYNAKLIAKDYTQTYRVDYQETFAPVQR